MNKNISGIYSITNTVNGKTYYGSSVNVWGRKRQHFHSLRKGKHRNNHLQAAWNLYGESSFIFALAEEASVEDLVAVEQRYLDGNTDGYNVSKCAEVAPRGLKWSAEAKRKVSEQRKGRRLSDAHKKTLSLAGKGRKMTEAQKSQASERMKGIAVGDEVKEKISAAVTSLWEDEGYRERMIAAQTAGKGTEEARKNYSNVSAARWADPEHRKKMSAARKEMWADPVFRAKMLEKRKAQGERLREKNQKEKESQDALQERESCV